MYETLIVNVGSVFLGIGGMIILLVGAYFMYQFVRIFRSAADVDEKICLIEEFVLDDIAKKKGIDLNKKIMEKRIFKESKYNFRRMLRKQMYEEMFGKETKKEK